MIDKSTLASEECLHCPKVVERRIPFHKLSEPFMSIRSAGVSA